MRIQFSRVVIAAAASLLAAVASAQIVVAPIDGSTVTPQTLADSLLSPGSGITITNVTYSGANGATGSFSGGSAIIGIDSGVVLTSGSVDNVVGPNDDSGASTENGLPGDADLDALAGDTTNDASVLTITFVPTGNTVQFSYVFGSEEYNEFIGQFNDVFGFFVNGSNRALIPGTLTQVSVNSINCGIADPGVAPSGSGSHCNLFVNNDPPVHNTQLDGFTTVLSLTATVTPNVPNTLKIAIADTSDDELDSAVFIAAGSLGVCGGVDQPPCAAPPPPPPQAQVPVPTLNDGALAALALVIAALGVAVLRPRA
jgi:hypothetical protein